MAWVKSFHVIFMVAWFAGLFYLPRLFVYHTLSDDAISIARFKIMERKLFWGITTPSAALTLLFGLWMLIHNLPYYMSAGWMQLKLGMAASLILYHIWCGKLLYDFKRDRNVRSHIWYRWFNEVPVAFLVIIVILVIVRPF